MIPLPDQQDQRPSLAPAVIGFVLAGLLLLGLGFWSAHRRKQPRDTPRVTLIQPVSDTTVSGPLTLLFHTRPRISPGPGGWRTGQHHLHALIDGTELMPAAADIHDLGGQRYRWTLPAIGDSALVQLVWAMPNHQRLGDGASARIRVRSRLP